MLASNINHGDINTMVQQTYIEQSDTKKTPYLNSSDSDDEDQPPALSDYALALLQKDKDSNNNNNNNNNITKPKLHHPSSSVSHHQQQQIPKRVNFHKDSRLSNNNNNAISNNHTSHTNQSEYETIFTKNVNGDLHSIASSSPNEKTQKTPSSKFSSAHNSSFSSDHSNVKSRSSIRRNRTLGSLGPPKRAVKIIDENVSTQQQNTIPNEDESNTLQADGNNNHILKSSDNHNVEVTTPRARKVSVYSSANLSRVTPQKEVFNFEGLNPYQYSKKHNLPASELPKLVKLYFEQQKLQTRETLALNSPARLRDALYTKIEDELQYREGRSPFKPEPRQKLFKTENANNRSSLASNTNINNNTNRYLPINDRVPVFADKENQDLRPKNIQNSIERPSRVSRKPLVPLSDLNQHIQHKSNSISSQNTGKPLVDRSYHEHHIQQVEPLKEPDFSNPRSNSRIMAINGKQYEKLELLGKGGSSKVFKVKSMSNKVYAVKKISFDEFDDSSIKGFKGEIDLLTRLRDKERVVKLVDHCLGQGSLVLIMECGDIDLSHVLAKRLDVPLDVEFVRFHANEVLKCVKAVHDAGIIHSDLKPANFLFVKGMLKIIDFGIANAVPEHTLNIYRENQIGTPNYMAPEALIDNNQHLAETTLHHKSTWKVGKPSDIWSCGCIIYQMIYGRPPYGGYQGSQRLLAIMNPEVKIPYPEKGLGGVKVPGTAIQTIEECLHRDPNKRWAANDILEGPFLKPRVVSEQFVNDLVKNAITYGVGKSSIGDEELKTLADDVWRRVSQLSL